MSTTVTYSDVTFSNISTMDFTQEAVLDEAEANVLYHKFTVSFQAILHLEALTYAGLGAVTGTGIDINGDSATAQANLQLRYVNLRQRMAHNRLNFAVKVNGDTILSANASTDVNHGPKVQTFRLTQIAPAAYHVVCTIEAALTVCSDSPPAVLSNRWSLSDAVDGNLYLQRSYEGTLVCGRPDVNPQAFRLLVTPPLQKGFRRESMQFTTDPSGKKLQYVIRDRRTHASAPRPATSWSVSQREETGLGGAVGTTTLTVSLIGPPEVDRKLLIALALQIYTIRRDAGGGNGENRLTLNASITERFGEHEAKVDLLATFRRAPDSSTGSYFDGLSNAGFGDNPAIPGWDPEQSIVPVLYDQNGLAGMFAAFVQDPCSTNPNAYNIRGGSTGIFNEETQGDEPGISPGSAAGATYLQSTVPLPDAADQSKYSDEQTSEAPPFTFFTLSNEYRTNTGIIALPSASSDGETAHTQVHSPKSTRILTIHAEKMSVPPSLPRPDDGNGMLTNPDGVKEVLLDYDIVTHAPRLSADGRGLSYASEGRYVYSLVKPPVKYRIGTTPLTNEPKRTLELSEDPEKLT